MRILILSVICFLFFGFAPSPKPGLKGSWYCCWPAGYVEMHFSGDRFLICLPNSGQLHEYRYKLKADTLFINNSNKTLDYAVLKFHGKDTLNLSFTELEESYSICRLKTKAGYMNNSEKLLQDYKSRSEKSSCINTQDTVPFIYFQF